MIDLSGKTILVTGGTKGIGQAIALKAAAHGADVLIAYVSDREASDRTLSELRNTGRNAAAFQADLSSEEGVMALFEEIRNHASSIDALVNSAGVFATAPLEKVSSASFSRHFSVNVFGLTYAIREALPLFPKSGASIVNIGSSVSSFTPAGSVEYNASKGAVDAITRTLANELGPRGVRVNSINPGLTETPGMRQSEFSSESFKSEIKERTPLRRIGVPDDISGAACFLISEDSSWLTGETLIVGGGLH
ncbi:hypothetical protein AL755_04095 [Arthrobacter sp. ERGS1:01]|uniref:SDR family NAD(P)-dependent oxidoreductase n=1 Tax=Arthrobacter sp. ERGS1:01 TaxID=1704044 RepID=UPI0006B52E01|nr:SDR family oxidoreductase [Arthrobacter sp. ERGS1:01]ALE04871.1 hypothetical protein AL755_04095 [Arthrobacter sp. ERGS1:01]